MPRKSRSEILRSLRVRIKKSEHFVSYLVASNSPGNASSRVPPNGRVISVTKISPEEVLKVGEYWKIGSDLMREFKQDRVNARQQKFGKEVVNG